MSNGKEGEKQLEQTLESGKATFEWLENGASSGSSSKVVADVSQKVKTIVRSILTFLTQPYRDWILSRLIKGRRVLILGSGSTASQLEVIPSDMCILTCNRGPEILRQRGLRHIDLYISNIRIVRESSHCARLDSFLTNFDISVFLFRQPRFIRRNLKSAKYRSLLLDRSVGGRDHFYLKRLIYPYTVRHVIGTSQKSSPTTGIGLLLYALYYQAKEVYLAGIDLDGMPPSSATDHQYKQTYQKAHKDMDYNVTNILSKKYNNIYVTSKLSPLASIFPFRKLTT